MITQVTQINDIRDNKHYGLSKATKRVNDNYNFDEFLTDAVANVKKQELECIQAHENWYVSTMGLLYK